MGRIGHSALYFEESVFVFGGGFMFNRKKMQRECTNTVWRYDLKRSELKV